MKIEVLINTSCKILKIFLASEVKKIDFPIALIFDIYVEFLDLLFFDKFMTISLALALLLPTNLLLSALNVFEIKFDDLIVFNREINSIAILLKP